MDSGNTKAHITTEELIKPKLSCPVLLQELLNTTRTPMEVFNFNCKNKCLD